MADNERNQLEARVRELEDYLESLASGGAGRYAKPSRRKADEIEEEIVRTRRDIEELKKRLSIAK